MDIDQFFLTLFLILVLARFIGELFARYSIPSVLGEILAGVLLGNSVLGWIEVNDILKILAEIGIILLLFQVGLESDFDKLKHAGKKAFFIAILGVVLPFSFGFITSYYFFHLAFDISLFVGGTLTATSIGITLRVLKDIKLDKTSAAQIVIGAAIVDDIIGIVLLVFIYDYSISHTLDFNHTFSVIGMIFGFLLLAPIVAKLLSHFIEQYHHKVMLPGYIPTVIISLILAFSFISHHVGAPAILGSFVAGAALSRRFFLPFGSLLKTNPKLEDEIDTEMKPIINLFTPIFFVFVGLSLDINVIDFSSSQFWIMGSILVLGAFVSKFVTSFLIIRNSVRNNTIIGMSMIPRGEVGIIFAEMGRVHGILPTDIYAILIFVIIVTTVIPPLLLKRYFKIECIENG